MENNLNSRSLGSFVKMRSAIDCKLEITQKKGDNNETIRMVWDRDKENYYLSVIDIVSILSESKDGKTYWWVLKHRLKN